jgi:predicted AAA+ superfamily ATPase
VLLEGPKACGKTSTALRQSASQVRLDASPQQRAAGLADPFALLRGETPRLLDEWQLVPDVWNAVRAEVDDRGVDGQFILTGSATPADDVTRHSGAMRIARIAMRPMSLAESGDSSKHVSLERLMAGEPASAGEPGASLVDVAQVLCRGGWPSNLSRRPADAFDANRDYLATVSSADIVTIDGVRRDPRKVQALLFALARSCATYVTKPTLQRDVRLHGESMAIPTLDSYLDALTRLWLLVEQPAWGEHLRSSAQVRRTPKRHLVDPSLAAAALKATPSSLMADWETFGQLFESLVYRDLWVYARAMGAEVMSYQDNRGAEIDAVVVRDGQWSAFEVKLNPHPDILDAAAVKLRQICAHMRTPPQAMTLLTSTGPAYRRSDGVNVVPIVALGP